MRGSKARAQLLPNTCLTWSSFPKCGIFPCPCRGVRSSRKQRLYPWDELWSGYKIRWRFLYAKTRPGWLFLFVFCLFFQLFVHCNSAPWPQLLRWGLLNSTSYCTIWLPDPPDVGKKANPEGYCFQSKIWNVNVPIHLFCHPPPFSFKRCNRTWNLICM